MIEDSPALKKIMITVDVEAQPRRAEREPVDRLIWGQYPEGQSGIGEMMSIAERYGAQLTMFLDYCERDIHGDRITEVGQEIHSRNHDLQLHAHPDFMSSEFWASKGQPRIANLNETTLEQASILFDFLVDEHLRCTNEKPIGYRGGGYRFNHHLLSAMVDRGIRFHSSYNPPRETQPLKFDFKKQFKWSNGCIETPISCVPKYRNLSYPLEFNFNVSALSSVEHMTGFVNCFHNEFGEDAIAVLVMHSWSLLEFDRESGYFTKPSPANMERFESFLRVISKTHEIITASDILMLDDEKKLTLDPSLELSLFDQLEKHGDGLPRIKTTTKEYDDLSGPELSTEAEKLWNDSQKDPYKEQAVHLFEKAYQKGDRRTAGYRLGVAYYYGYGVEKNLSKAYEFLGIPELDNTRYALFFRGRILNTNGFYGHDKVKAWHALNTAAEMGVDAAKQELVGLPEPENISVEKTCPICGSPGVLFEKLQGRQCPDCGSLERQRVFALAYDECISRHCDLAGKYGLIISPSVSERRFFESRKVGGLTSVDIRPEAKSDIVADICDMPGVKSDSYDFVYASYVFTCVHDLDRAFREIKRVLKPDGCLVSIDHVVFGAEIEEFTDREKITSWYGDSNYEKYKVGSFRSLGEKGLFEHLSRYFNVRAYRAVDPITDLELVVFFSQQANCEVDYS